MSAPRVVVVGAGLSGLVCARRLKERGISVVVIEARERVGGRTLSVPFRQRRIDLGGQWLSPGQPRLAALAAELGVATEPQYRRGRAVIGRPARTGLRVPGLATFDAWRRFRELDRLVQSGVSRQDRSVADWLDRRAPRPSTRELIELMTELKFAASVDELSLDYFLAALRACGGIDDDASFEHDVREHRFVGGAQQLCERLAADLEVHHGVPVAAIDQSPTSVTVRAHGLSVEAERCVLAAPPASLGAIRVHGVSAAREAAQQRMPAGPVVKLALGYERPFWRERGLSGEAYRVGEGVRAVVDLCGAVDDAALLAFVVGPSAHAFAEQDSVAAVDDVCEQLAELFGDEARHPNARVWHDWGSDPWSTGCVGNLIPETGADMVDALRAPCGRVHYAGSETATRWPRYMEGAIESGERAADEAAAALR